MRKRAWRWVLRHWLEWKYRDIDPNVCGCGSDMDTAYPGISCPGVCRSYKKYIIETELEKLCSSN